MPLPEVASQIGPTAQSTVPSRPTRSPARLDRQDSLEHIIKDRRVDAMCYMFRPQPGALRAIVDLTRAKRRRCAWPCSCVGLHPRWANLGSSRACPKDAVTFMTLLVTPSTGWLQREGRR